MAHCSQYYSNHNLSVSSFPKFFLFCGCCYQTWPFSSFLSFLQITAHFPSFPKFIVVVYMLLADMVIYSQFPSNHSPFFKLSKVYSCCVHAASRHGQLFSVSFKSQLIFQAFQSLIPLCDCYKHTWPIVLSLVQIRARFQAFKSLSMLFGFC